MLDLVREVRPPFSPESVVSEFARTLRDYLVFTVAGDRYDPASMRALDSEGAPDSVRL